VAFVILRREDKARRMAPPSLGASRGQKAGGLRPGTGGTHERTRFQRQRFCAQLRRTNPVEYIQRAL